MQKDNLQTTQFPDLVFVKNAKNMVFDLKYALERIKLYDFNGDISKKWEVAFYVWDLGNKKFVRKKDYSINKERTVEGRLEAANKLMSTIKSVLKKGACIPAQNTKNNILSIEEALMKAYELKSLSYSHRSKESIKPILQKFITFLGEERAAQNVETLKRLDILNFRLHLCQKTPRLSNKTINAYCGYVTSLVGAMVELTLLETNPFLGMRSLKELKTKRNRGLNEEEAVELKIALMQHRYSLWLYVQFVFYCWLRPREISLLRCNNFDMKKGVIYVRANDTKGKKDDIIHIPSKFLEVLKPLKIDKRDPNLFIFSKSNKEDMFGEEGFDETRFTKMHKGICRKLGFDEDITLYSWKREGVKAAFESGANLNDIREHGRWTSFKELLTYLRNSGIDNSGGAVIKGGLKF